MYPDNIYIQHAEEMKNMDKNPEQEGIQNATIGTAFDLFDQKYNLKHNDLLRAQYCHWRAVETGAKELLPPDYKKLLIENGFKVDF